MTELQKVELDIKKTNKIFADKLPLSNYAFSFALFIQKLYCALERDNISDVFFLAREGAYLKRLFDAYQEIIGKSVATSHYLYISRKSCVSATLQDVNSDAYKIFGCYPAMSLNAFLNAMGFLKDDIVEIANEIKADKTMEIDNFFSSSTWHDLKSNQLFQHRYNEIHNYNRSGMMQYLKKSGFATAENPAVVDVGWNGTMQNQLFALGLHSKLSGYYIGLMRGAQITEKNKKQGLLFEGSDIMNAFRYNNYYYEFICTADHGSTVRYDEHGTPVLKPDVDVDLYNNYFKDIQILIMNKFRLICERVPHTESPEFYNRLFEKYHAKMLLSFDSTEKMIISAALKAHPDDLMPIKTSKTLRNYLSLIKKYLILIERSI